MITYILEIIQLTEIEFIYCSFVVFFAGIVRGFSGFALSAIVVVSMVGILPTIQLIPMVLFLEAVAGIVMLRGGIRDANMPVVWILSIGSILGIPIGLLATVILPAEISRIIALILILFLSSLQLFKLIPGILSSKPALYTTGMIAGIASGIASVGGMVVALYVLASEESPKSMRGAIVMFLFIGLFTSMIWYLIYGIMDTRAALRGVIFIPILLVGIFIGFRLFSPVLQKFYKQFCLVLLILISLIGLFRAVI
ncbi:MAG: sulfite exporter TauE/SafE family protein [Amylibacter sp.]|nr:sulfite exporter TauE/SafE family protein [Amylibacter sp.]